MQSGKDIFLKGMRDGIPIGIGYFAVAFSLGIIAKKCGFTAIQGFFASLSTYASAGQYIGFTLYAADAALFQLVIMTVITNARYLLMGFALNQRIPEGTGRFKRFLIGLTITDEIFGITIAREGPVVPHYGLGAMTVAVPLWSLGTALGIYMGNVLPANVVSALSVALFGMFLAVIIPPAKKDMKIMVSACLAGEKCKYNGGNNRNEKVLQLMAENEVITVCPEQMGGLPTLRVPSEIKEGVVTARDGRIIDKEFRAGAAKCLEIAMREKSDLIVLQSRSPSCGIKQRYDGTFTGTLVDGAGVTAQLLIENGFQCVDIEDLDGGATFRIP